MKRWYPYLIALLLIVILAYFITRLNVPTNLIEIRDRDKARNTPKDIEKTRDLVPKDKDVLELRQQHQLRPLTKLEGGKNIQNLPNGIYGFSMCNVALLNAMRSDPSELEIHKHHDGIVYYVGYASDEHIGRYLARPKNFHILMSPRSWEGASSLFEIPVDFVSKCEGRPLRDGYLFDLFITTIPELQT